MSFPKLLEKNLLFWGGYICAAKTALQFTAIFRLQLQFPALMLFLGFSWSVYHLTQFRDAPILKMHSCGWASGSAEIVGSETESARHALMDGGYDVYSSVRRLFPLRSSPASVVLKTSPDRTLRADVRSWSDSKLAEWDWIVMCDPRLREGSFTRRW